jgi:hypothetical protein
MLNCHIFQMPSSPSQAALDGGAGGGETLECGTLYTFGLGKAGQVLIIVYFDMKL